MKIRDIVFSIITAGCVLGIFQAQQAKAEVSDEDFKKLSEAVEQLSGKVEALEKTHEQDQQTIKQLKEQVGTTKEIASSAQQKADAATEKLQQPVTSVPDLANAATHNVSLVGDAEVEFAKVAGQHGAFSLGDFAPIFLYRANDNILFEAGFDFQLSNNPGGAYTTNVNLSFATLDYVYNDYVTIEGGNMLLPLGTYSERGAGWLNKIPDTPLPRAILPGNGIGMQLRGAIPIGQTGQSLTYSVYSINGESSIDGSGNAAQLDLQNNVGPNNFHGGMGWGGRIGYFYPWQAHYDLEIGLSAMSGSWVANEQYTAGVVDMALHIGSSVEIKGEYINTWVGSSDMGTITPHGWWLQGGYKFAGLNLDLPYINSLELVGRYDTVNDGMGSQIDRGTVGSVYYLTNTLWLEGDFEFTGSHGSLTAPSTSILFQLSYGF